MKVTIIGTGYVGLVTGACLAELGNEVFCLDVDEEKVAVLNRGGVPIHEPGLGDLIARNVAAARLKFSTDVAASVAHGDLQFIAVGTPPDQDGSADLQYVMNAARNIAQYMTNFKVVVDKSTVPVGTAERVTSVMNEVLTVRSAQHGFSVVSNPEFLKEGAAIDDFMRPDRIVIGSDENEYGHVAREQMKKLYKPFNRNHERTLYMDVRSAELTKYAANAMLAARISFMNEIANLADRVGADIEAVRRGVGSDPRIGYDFLYAGCGYGGSCFPKDVRALVRAAEEVDYELKILQSVEAVNEAQKTVLSEKILSRFGEDLVGRRFGIWGLAFKPNTDDMREAPSRALIKALVRKGATVAAYDPVAKTEAQRTLAIDLVSEVGADVRLLFVTEKMAAISGADALIIMTEWKEFKSPDFGEIRSSLKKCIIFDGRNLYDPESMTQLGIEYYGIGRSNQNAGAIPSCREEVQ